MLGEFINRRAAQCEDRDSEGAVDIKHSLRISPNDRIRKPTTAQHDLLVVAQFISWPDETLLHAPNATDRRSWQETPERVSPLPPRRARLRTAHESKRLRAGLSESYGARVMSGRCSMSIDRNGGSQAGSRPVTSGLPAFRRNAVSGPPAYRFIVMRSLESDHDLSTDDLFARLITDLRSDDDDHLGALVALHNRPTQLVFDRSIELCCSEEPFDRMVGLRVLREVKHQTVDRRLMWDRAAGQVIKIVREDKEPGVVACAISCFAYQPGGEAALHAALARADDTDSTIRLAVADALPNLISDTDGSAVGVQALVKLTKDDDADVRSYALMGLVNDLGYADRERSAVEARLLDVDEQIRRVAREALDILR